MRIGHVTDPSMEIVKAIKQVKEEGFDYPEITMEGPYSYTEKLEENKNKIKEILQNWNGYCLGHAPLFTDISSYFTRVRKAWMAEIKNLVDISKSLNMEKLTMHFVRFDFAFGTSKDKESLEMFVNSIKDLMEYAEDMDLVLENVSRPEVPFESYGYILKEIPNLKFNIDIGHANVEGGMELIEKMILELNNKIGHLHFSDNLGEEDDHIEIGNGNIDWNKIGNLINKINYNDTITLEVFEPKQSNRKEQARVNSLQKIRGMFNG